jgi:uncharacterized membrane protein YdbT with pleckstrin-like domain
MKYYRKVMRPDEKLTFYCTLHWIVYWPALLFLALGGIALAVFAVLHAQGQGGAIFELAAVILLLLAVFTFLRAFFRRVGTEIVVTDHRVIYKRGLLSRYTVEMNVSKIETVDVEQSVWGRLFGYGDVLIRGTGGSFEPLLGIAHPLDLRSAILVG